MDSKTTNKAILPTSDAGFPSHTEGTLDYDYSSPQLLQAAVELVDAILLLLQLCPTVDPATLLARRPLTLLLLRV